MQIISILQQASVRLKKTVASLYGDTFRLIAYRKSYSQIKQTLSRKIVRTKSVMLIIVCDEMFLTITWSICQPMMHNPCERLYENIVTTHTGHQRLVLLGPLKHNFYLDQRNINLSICYWRASIIFWG